VKSRAELGWQLNNVGCSWYRGDYTISTYRCGSKSGYYLWKDQKIIGTFRSWSAANKKANRRRTNRRIR